MKALKNTKTSIIFPMNADLARHKDMVEIELDKSGREVVVGRSDEPKPAAPRRAAPKKPAAKQGSESNAADLIGDTGEAK